MKRSIVCIIATVLVACAANAGGQIDVRSVLKNHLAKQGTVNIEVYQYKSSVRKGEVVDLLYDELSRFQM